MQFGGQGFSGEFDVGELQERRPFHSHSLWCTVGAKQHLAVMQQPIVKAHEAATGVNSTILLLQSGVPSFFR